MHRKLLSFVICFFALSAVSFGQVTIEGTVTDAQSGETLPGVNVLIQELQRGTATNSDGEFSISGVESGTYTLVATFIGYQRFTTQIEVGSQDITQNIELSPDVQRQQRALGYSVSEVESDALANQAQSDVSRILKGKVPGVNITQTSGVSGTATDFVIRGYSTISGSNQPLFIVDGVRFNTDTNTGGENFFEGGALSTSSRFLDLDPNNIQNINVLKGLAATTMYGEQGRNGVVLITTKSGNFGEDREPGFDITLNQSVFVNEIASLPDYQDQYGGGFHQNFGYFFSNWGPHFDSEKLSDVNSFMGYMNPQGELVDEDCANCYAAFPHPYSQFSDPSLQAAFPQYQGEAFAYKPYNNVGPFFRKGLVSNSNINISGGTQDVNLNLSVGHSDEEGFTPGNSLIKNNVSLGANFKPLENLTFRTTANVSLTDMETPPIAASYGSSADPEGGGSIFGDVFYTPRSVDLNGLPWENPVDNSSVYYRSGNDIQNPYWTLNNIKRTDNVDRLYGKTEVIYDIIDEVSLTYKLGLDTYSESQAYLRNAGGVNHPNLTGGYMHTRSIKNEIWDHNLYFNFSTQPTQEITFEGTLGGQFVLNKYETDGIASTDQIIFDLFEHPNFTSPSATNGLSGSEFQYRSREENAGVFLDATVGYNDWVYLSLSGRNDWFSTLEPENRSIFYPSASISFIPTDAFDIGGDVLSYLKLRGGIGTSAGAPSPYNTRSSLSVDARNFLSGGVITTNAVSNSLGNPDLKAERLLEYEIGIESQFFDNQLGLEVTAYHRTTEDLITSADLDPSTGYTNTLVNIGEIQNQGIEVSLNGSPVSGEFTWNTRWNFFAYESEVIDLGQDLSEIAVAGFTNLGNFAIEGEPLNVIQGSAIARDDQGRRLVNENGDYIFSDEIEIIGDPNPDYTLSSINTFNFKNFSLTTQVDYQHGGDVYSTTIATLLARGMTTDTGFDRQVPVVLPGYRQITNDQGEVVNTIENSTQISATQAFFSNIGFGPDEVSMYDATNIRLSEVTLSYNLPASIVSQTPLRGISVSASAFNLWYFTPNMPEGTNFDPNVAGTGADNGLGFDYLAGPSARRYGGSIQVQF